MEYVAKEYFTNITNVLLYMMIFTFGMEHMFEELTKRNVASENYISIIARPKQGKCHSNTPQYLSRRVCINQRREVLKQ